MKPYADRNLFWLKLIYDKVRWSDILKNRFMPPPQHTSIGCTTDYSKAVLLLHLFSFVCSLVFCSYYTDEVVFCVVFSMVIVLFRLRGVLCCQFSRCLGASGRLCFAFVAFPTNHRIYFEIVLL